MTRRLALVLVLVTAACATGTTDMRPPPPTTVDVVTPADLERTVVSLKAELDQLRTNEEERARVEQRQVHAVERASRAAAGRRRVRAAGTRPAIHGGGCEQWRPLIAAHFPADAVNRAVAICNCESRGNPAARNPRSSATGLFQILRGSTDPVANVTQAAAMYRTRGWKPWAACL